MVPAARTLVRGLTAANSRGLVTMAHRLVPQTAEVLAEHLGAGPPALRRTVTPAEAREGLAVQA
ncbi:MAG: hypothetical protein JWR37_1817 [Mycobacterium sp.]|nr:hypothetical protein [Mycobacterium sp.]